MESPCLAAEGVALSIIIPCRNDADALTETLQGIMSGLRTGDEVIVADASTDSARLETEHLLGAAVVRCDRCGRGPQMNAGARAATGDVLVFSHADTLLTAAHLEAIRGLLMAHPELKAGAFFKDTAAHYPAWAWADPLVRWWMGCWGLVYGDQSVFMRRSLFTELGGFADLPLMEDVEMSGRLRRTRAFRLIGPPLRTSMRRFARRGRFFTRLQNMFYVLLFRCGVSPKTLYRWYYGKPVDGRDTQS